MQVGYGAGDASPAPAPAPNLLRVLKSSPPRPINPYGLGKTRP